MDRQTRYPREVRERAVRLVFEHQREYNSQWAAITSIATKLGMTPETLRKWVRRAETDQGLRPGLTSTERERMKQLERENRELRRTNEILKAARVSSGRSSTAAAGDDRLHRRTPEGVRGRADLRGAADGPVHVLRGEEPAAFGSGAP
jgi:transposase